jgi:hypothetical protein
MLSNIYLSTNFRIVYGIITGGVATPLPAISGAVMFPFVAFPPPPVIFSSCANAGVVIDIPPVEVAAAIAKAAAATNIVA